MPAYLCHGFRWQRRSIRVYVIVQDIDDASPEWIIPAKSSQCLLESFYNLFDFLPFCSPPSRDGNRSNSDGGGGIDDDALNTLAYRKGRSRSRSLGPKLNGRSQSRRQRSRSRRPTENRPAHPPDDEIQSQDWSAVKLLEEYDPLNLSEVSRPYAYVADYAVRIDLSASIAEEIQKYEERNRGDRDPPMTGPASDETGRKKSNKKPGWFEKLRDQLQRGEEIKWYVVVNGDEVRDWPDEPAARQQQQQQQHHAQYAHQQKIFEGNGADARLPLPPAAGGRSVPRRPSVSNREPPTLRPKMSMDSMLRPKTPSKRGSIRKLFGRGKAEEHVY